MVTPHRHGGIKLFPQRLIALIFRQIQLIEAGMAARQTVLVAKIAVDIEPAEAVHALQLLEAVERHLGRARHKLQQLGLFFGLEAAHRAPEPLHLRRRLRVVVVLCVVLPVVDVDVW